MAVTRIYARVTAEGVAANETAVCGEHILDSPEGDSDVLPDPPVDASGNEALECVICGATA